MVKSIKLNDGNSIPVVAFGESVLSSPLTTTTGTGTALYGKECSDLVLEALHNGYISLDTAQGYSNTTSVGAALLRWEGKREDVYILSKCECDRSKSKGGGVWTLTRGTGSKPTNDDINNPRIVLEGMLKELDTTYVDMCA
jgi:diketogulonate reductase-like aldo/keto reductase